MSSIGFIGLGMMGSRMVQRLLEAGYNVTGHNRSREKAQPLIERGMRWGERPRAGAQASDVI